MGRRVDGHDVVVDRHGRQADHRDREVHAEHGEQHELDGARHVAPRVGRLLGHVGDRLDAGVGHRADRDAVDELVERRRGTEVDLGDQQPRRQKDEQPDNGQQHLGGEVGDGQDDVKARRLLDAEDVDDHQEDDDGDAAHRVVRPGLEDGPECGQVVGHEEGRDGDRDDVVEHQRPAGAEAHELVEGVTGEARRAAGLGEHRGGLGIREGRHDEQQAGEHEDQRREPQGVERHHAERVVDRRTDVAVGCAEQRRNAQHLVKVSLSLLASRHLPAHVVSRVVDRIDRDDRPAAHQPSFLCPRRLTTQQSCRWMTTAFCARCEVFLSCSSRQTGTRTFEASMASLRQPEGLPRSLDP